MEIVLFDTFELEEWMHLEHRDLRRWEFSAIPLDLYAGIGPDAFDLGGMETGFISMMISQKQLVHEWHGHACPWPQRIGHRVVLKLLERGRVAFGLFHEWRSIRRATGQRIRRNRRARQAVRVEPNALLAAMYAAGGVPQLKPIPRGEWLRMRDLRKAQRQARAAAESSGEQPREAAPRSVDPALEPNTAAAARPVVQRCPT